MPFTIEFQHDIAASPEQVWAVLADLNRYHEWNTFVERCESSLVVGESIRMRVRVLPWMAQAQTEFVFENEPQKLLSYGIKPAPLGAMKSYRSHRLSPLPDGGTRYESLFQLSGWFSPVVALLLGRFLRDGFRRMSQGVADEAQRRA